MPENWRQVATLRLIEGRPTREVCAMLNITEKACYSRVSRIRKYLEEIANGKSSLLMNVTSGYHYIQLLRMTKDAGFNSGGAWKTWISCKTAGV